jgi:DNA-directed RNA polymerase specialized sigma24 family protein
LEKHFMKYLRDPERPQEPILEASPREIDAHRDWLRRCLRSSWSLDDADVEDAVQNTLIVACRLIAEKRVRGTYSMRPEKRLRALLRVILRNFAANIKRAQRKRSDIVNDMSLAEFVPDAHSAADAKLEARETLKAVCDDNTKCVRMLVRIAMGDEPAEVAREIGRHENTIRSAVNRGRNKVKMKHRNGRH